MKLLTWLVTITLNGAVADSMTLGPRLPETSHLQGSWFGINGFFINTHWYNNGIDAGIFIFSFLKSKEWVIWSFSFYLRKTWIQTSGFSQGTDNFFPNRNANFKVHVCLAASQSLVTLFVKQLYGDRIHTQYNSSIWSVQFNGFSIQSYAAISLILEHFHLPKKKSMSNHYTSSSSRMQPLI